MKAYLIYPEQLEEMSRQHFENVAYAERGSEKEWGTIIKDDNGISIFAPFSTTYLEEDYPSDIIRIPMKAGR